MDTSKREPTFFHKRRALTYKDLPFESLGVDGKVALEIFQHKYKIDFIEEKSSQNSERLSGYTGLVLSLI